MKRFYGKIYKLIKNRDFEHALSELCDLRTFSLKNPFGVDPNHSWYLIGDILYHLKNFEKASVAFEESLKNRRDDDQALLALSNCYFKQGMPDLAEKCLLQAIDIEPKESYLYNLANCMFDQKKFKEAIIFYDKVISMSNESDLKKMARKNRNLAERKRRHF